MEVEAAARRYLMRDPTVAGYVQDRVYKNEAPLLDSSGQSWLVVSRGSGWASPDDVQSAEFPRLIVDCTSDPDRENGLIVRDNAADKAYALARVVTPLFTFPNLRGRYIGGIGSTPGLFVISASKYAEPRLRTPADQHPPREGDTVTVRCEFALMVVH